jgi:hypothetical protein
MSGGSWGPPPWAIGLGLVATAALVAWLGGDAALPIPQDHAALLTAGPVSPPLPALPVALSEAPPPAAAIQAPAAAAPTTPRIPRLRDPNGDQTPDLADYINEGEPPTMGEVIAGLHRAGVTTGLGAFNPPGTRPPLLGLAVPEGFELPAGFVRHYQATDDGQRIEAVLMFAPDAQPRDAAGRPVALPADRLVPPELAPPGLPIRRISVPAPRS